MTLAGVKIVTRGRDDIPLREENQGFSSAGSEWREGGVYFFVFEFVAIVKNCGFCRMDRCPIALSGERARKSCSCRDSRQRKVSRWQTKLSSLLGTSLRRELISCFWNLPDGNCVWLTNALHSWTFLNLTIANSNQLCNKGYLLEISQGKGKMKIIVSKVNYSAL